MKKKLAQLSIITILCLPLILFPGCTTSTPSSTPGAPPVYSVNPAVTNAQAIVQGVATVAAPFNPAAGVTNYGIDAVFGLIAAISAYVAKQKNSAANAQQAAAASLAATVVQLGLPAQTSALQTATKNGSAQLVADHLDNANSPT